MDANHTLDLYSTSPNSGTCAPPKRCTYNNVWFAYQIEGGRYGITQGCCNHWDCERCGEIRARQEYARIVYGIHILAKDTPELYFQTITCRGKELSHTDAEAGYLEWTNRLLDSYRARVLSRQGLWAYVQVTERQKRGHPHSHLLTTFQPGDLALGWKADWKRVGGRLQNRWKAAYRSEWLQKAVKRSGLGEEYDISLVRDERAASRYVAKYMFKQTAFATDWPKGWKRVRYSQSFPKLPEIKTDAFVLRTWEDWDDLARRATIVICSDEDTYDYAGWKLRDSSIVVRRKAKSGEIKTAEIVF